MIQSKLFLEVNKTLWGNCMLLEYTSETIGKLTSSLLIPPQLELE